MPASLISVLLVRLVLHPTDVIAVIGDHESADTLSSPALGSTTTTCLSPRLPTLLTLMIRDSLAGADLGTSRNGLCSHSQLASG